ncbi:MAG: dihydroorotase family protein [Candidatus Peregrinibacteria bacterium]|nr:dihydroorotase family protein [Candidatus Peregrinibacteria bacterium]MCB9807912.1 dihydroorotase family protein [Candidatus Peribacteria bacterium]
MSNLITLPGLIDCHVHFREPGFEHKATMKSEAASARAGGVLTACEMPNTSPPCVTVNALRQKIAIADTITDCDIHFFFGITEASHMEEFQTAWNDEGLRRRLCGVKLYLDHSTGNQKVDGGIVEDIFKRCSELGAPLVAHCEDAEINAEAAKMFAKQTDVSLHSLMRPSASEATAIEYAINLAKKHGTPFHIAHLSTAQGIDLVRTAKAEGVTVTCEVAPHHLFLSIHDYDRLGPLGKMNPPLRPLDDVEALWKGIEDGTVDCIATDHAPHTLEEKTSPKNPLDAPSGVPGVETMLPLLLTKLSPDQIKMLCYENPNRIFSLNAPSEPRITIDLDEEWVIHARDLHSKCDWTPYEGMTVRGRVVTIT